MKKETDTRCSEMILERAAIYGYRRECKGALFSVKVSTMEEHLNHRVYECDQCHKRWKFTGDSEVAA